MKYRSVTVSLILLCIILLRAFPCVPAQAFAAARTPESSDEEVITGTRLLLLLSENGCVRFARNGAVVTFPAAALEQLDIRETDSLYVSLQLTGQDGFLLSVHLNDQPVTYLESIQVILPFHGLDDGFLPALTESSTGECFTGSYSQDLETASFELQHTGRYLPGQVPSPAAQMPVPKAAFVPSQDILSITSAVTPALSRILAAAGLGLVTLFTAAILVIIFRQRRK